MTETYPYLNDEFDFSWYDFFVYCHRHSLGGGILDKYRKVQGSRKKQTL